VEEDVLSALVNLGYQRAAAEKALAGAVKNGNADPSMHVPGGSCRAVEVSVEIEDCAREARAIQ
jgi:hypothetical protein